MELDYYKRYEPIFGVWRIRQLIGSGSYGKVFEIERTDPLDGTVYTGALKVISIPGSDEQATDTLNSGMDAASASAYYLSCVKNLSNEIRMMAALKGHTNIVNYEDHQIYRQPNNIGWDILIRMELLTPISQYFSQLHTVPRQETIQLGIDICRALELCGKYNIIHRDIKPANIFISATGDYKLGDFGVARVADTASGASTRIGTVNYMAPEVFHGKSYTRSVDIYSLGLVLYQLLNNNRLPLLPPMPQPITPAAREQAQAQRLNGAVLPPPANASGKLAQIILKACAPDPADRYSDPAQMRWELEKLRYQDNGTTVLTPDPPADNTADSGMPGGNAPGSSVFHGGTLGGGTSGGVSHGGTIPPMPPTQPARPAPPPPAKPIQPPPPPMQPDSPKPKKLSPLVWVLIVLLVLGFFAAAITAQIWESEGSQTSSRSTSRSESVSSSQSVSSTASSPVSSVSSSEAPASTEVPASTEKPAESENHAVSSSSVSSSSSTASSSKAVSSSSAASSSKPTSSSSSVASSKPASSKAPTPAPTPAPQPTPAPASSTTTSTTPTNVVWDYKTVNGEIVIRGYGGSSSVTNLVIPSSIDGKPVVKIENSAFSGRSELKTVYVPSSVTYIAANAFSGTSLTSASIGAGCGYESSSFPSGCSISRH